MIGGHGKKLQEYGARIEKLAFLAQANGAITGKWSRFRSASALFDDPRWWN